MLFRSYIQNLSQQLRQGFLGRDDRGGGAAMWLYSEYILDRITDELKDVIIRGIKNGSHVFC